MSIARQARSAGGIAAGRRKELAHAKSVEQVLRMARARSAWPWTSRCPTITVSRLLKLLPGNGRLACTFGSAALAVDQRCWRLERKQHRISHFAALLA